jgi:transcriptional regulator with XRE-family HTH domain
VPPFYAIVELTGVAVPEAAAHPAVGLPDLPESATKLHIVRQLSSLRARCSIYKTAERLGNNISRIALHKSSLKGSAVAMAFAITGKRRQPNSADVQIGESIRAHRLIVGMSQSDLAGRLGVSFQQIQKYEKGMNRVGAGRLPQIARIFKIPISALFDVNADTSPGKSTGTTPVKLIPDRSSLKLLTSFGDIGHSKIRHSLVGLVDAIAKSTAKTPR